MRAVCESTVNPSIQPVATQQFLQPIVTRAVAEYD